MPRVIFVCVRIFIYLFPVLLVLWTSMRYFAFSGVQEFSYDFSKDSPFISILWPPEKTSAIYESDGDAMQDIIGDPTSFSIQLTQRNFTKVFITLQYKKNENIPLKLGLQKGNGSWEFFFKNLNEFDRQILDDWHRGRVVYDLTPEYVREDNTVNLLLSSPSLMDREELITLTKISVRLETSPIRLKSIFEKIGIFL